MELWRKFGKDVHGFAYRQRLVKPMLALSPLFSVYQKVAYFGN